MDQKAQIQYIDRFYVYGSEAAEAEPKKKIQLPKMPKLNMEKFSRIYVDPFAFLGIAVSAVMMVVLIVGAVQLKSVRAEYDAVSTLLNELKLENATLSHTYHTSYDLDEIREAAEKIGMVEADEAERFTVVFSVPERAQEDSLWDEIVWFVTGLFARDSSAS